MKKIRVAMLVFMDDEGHVLLNHRKDGLSEDENVWEIIGGGIDGDEHPLETIKREVVEELSYEINEEQDELTFVKQFKVVNENHSAEVHYFQAKFPGLENFSDSNEVFVSDLKLFPINEALELPLLPICKEVLRNHI